MATSVVITATTGKGEAQRTKEMQVDRPDSLAEAASMYGEREVLIGFLHSWAIDHQATLRRELEAEAKGTEGKGKGRRAAHMLGL